MKHVAWGRIFKTEVGFVKRDIRFPFDDVENIIVSGEVIGLAFRVMVVYLKDEKVRLHSERWGLRGLFEPWDFGSKIEGVYFYLRGLQLLFVIFKVIIVCVCFYFFQTSTSRGLSFWSVGLIVWSRH